MNIADIAKLCSYITKHIGFVFVDGVQEKIFGILKKERCPKHLRSLTYL